MPISRRHRKALDLFIGNLRIDLHIVGQIAETAGCDQNYIRRDIRYIADLCGAAFQSVGVLRSVILPCESADREHSAQDHRQYNQNG